MSDQDSRRRHPRVETKQAVWVEGQDLRVEAEARNMSKGGMFVVGKAEPPTVGQLLQIRFDDPHEGKVELKMEVVWRDETTVSSKFGLRAVDAHGSEVFERVVSRLQEGQHELAHEETPTLRPAPTTVVPEPE